MEWINMKNQKPTDYKEYLTSDGKSIAIGTWAPKQDKFIFFDIEFLEMIPDFWAEMPELPSVNSIAGSWKSDTPYRLVNSDTKKLLDK